jgi:hypothetical protein
LAVSDAAYREAEDLAHPLVTSATALGGRVKHHTWRCKAVGALASMPDKLLKTFLTDSIPQRHLAVMTPISSSCFSPTLKTREAL